jgi:hypothetical protein
MITEARVHHILSYELCSLNSPRHSASQLAQALQVCSAIGGAADIISQLPLLVVEDIYTYSWLSAY